MKPLCQITECADKALTEEPISTESLSFIGIGSRRTVKIPAGVDLKVTVEERLMQATNGHIVRKKFFNIVVDRELIEKQLSGQIKSIASSLVEATITDRNIKDSSWLSIPSGVEL